MYFNLLFSTSIIQSLLINIISASSFVLTPDSSTYYLTTLEEGEPFKIICRSKDGGLILWVKNTRISSSSQSTTTTDYSSSSFTSEVLSPYSVANGGADDEKNYTIHYEPFLSNYVLEIPNVTIADEGIYKCDKFVYENKNSDYYCDKCNEYRYNSRTSFSYDRGVELKILRAPVIISARQKVLKVNLGEMIELECAATGYPTPIIYWKRSNNTKFSTGGSKYTSSILKITSLSYEDLGTYYCVADNTVGKPAIEVVKLAMHYKMTATTSTTETSTTSEQSVEVTLNEEEILDSEIDNV